MVCRAIYSEPLLWKEIDTMFFGEAPKTISPSTVLKNLIPYAEKHLNKNGRLWDICKHSLNLDPNVDLFLCQI